MATALVIPAPVQTAASASPAQPTTTATTATSVALTLADLLALELASSKRKRPATHFHGIPVALILASALPLATNGGVKREFRTPRRLAYAQPVDWDKEEDDTDDEQPNGDDDDDDDDDDDIEIIW